MPRLSLAEVDHVALLARLQLTESERHRLRDDLDVILDQFEILQRLDTTGVPPTAHVLPRENVFHADVVSPSLERGEIVREAPESLDEFFVVPRVVET